MNKIELNTLTQVNNNERNFLSALNDNLKRIQAAINDTLSRSGVLPNQMEEVLDMNGKRIVNVGPAVNPTDVVTRQDIQNIIDAANEAIAQLDRLVEDGKIALMTYASEYIYPTCTAAVDACQLAQRKSEDAQGAAEAARDALLLNADYQAIVANLTTILALVDDIANLDAIAADLTNIDTVAGISSDISAVAEISSAVTTLAGISATLTALNDSLTAINGVYDDLSKIESVYTALPEVEAVYAALSDIGAVADALTAISSVAAALTTLANIEDNLTPLLAVGADLTNLDSIAADLTNLDSIANNLTEILRASTYASQAATSASNAQIWAEGTDQQVVPLGGQHSAKVWAQYIEEIIAGTRIYGGTFDSTTATATLTSSAKAKLGVTSDSIVLTNDSTAVTGYGANEGIEYYVAVEGTFASLTLHEGDILWSTGSAWKKIDNAATEIPDATEGVKGIAALASTVEAEAGLNDTKVMTPLKTKQAIETDVLKGATDPTTATTGYVGQRYLNTTTGDTFISTGYASTVNYTTTGSPTVSGTVVGGFSGSNYLQGPTFSSNSSDTWEIEFVFTTGSDVTSESSVWSLNLSGDNRAYLRDSRLAMNFDVFGIPYSAIWDSDPNYYVSISANTKYKAKFVYTGTEFQMYCVEYGNAYPSSPNCTKTVTVAVGSSTLRIGTDKYTSYYFRGSLDMAEFVITKNNVEVWRGVSVNGLSWKKIQGALTAGTGISISNGTISTDALRNTATGTSSTTVNGISSAKSYTVNIGSGSQVNDWGTIAIGNYAAVGGSSTGGIAIGHSSNVAASKPNSIAIGKESQVNAANAIILGGKGINNNPRTLVVSFNDGSTASDSESDKVYTLLNGFGKIPPGRYVAMTGADGTNAGVSGAVPAPTATDNTKFLRGDGTWAEAASTATYNSTTQEITLG